MTQEEKARAYDEALEQAKKIYDASDSDVNHTIITHIFPELRESESEKAKKIIASVFSEAGNRYIQKSERDIVLAYLEKQKEEKKEFHIPSYLGIAHYNPAPIEQKEQKLKNILTDDDSLQTAYLKGQTDVLEDPEAYGLQKEPAGWSEEDTLMLTAIIQTLERFGGRGTTGMQIDWLKSLRPQPREEIYHAAKHDLAIKFMNYIDENRPEGKMSLSNGECEDIDKAFKENDWAKIMRYVEKYSSQPKPEWSEKDKQWLSEVYFAIDHSMYSDEEKRAMKKYIDSLRPSWKPTEEQMNALQNAVALTACDKELARLYNQLKKL